MVNSSQEGKQVPFHSVFCSPTLLDGTRDGPYVDYTLVGADLLLAITAFVGNLIILCALKKESSFRPPTKLLYRTLTFTDLFVGLILHPTSLHTTYWKLWTRDGNLTGAVGSFFWVILCGVSLGILTAISVDRLLALSLRLRYRRVVTLNRVRAFVFFLCLLNTVNASLSLWHAFIFFILTCAMIVICLIASTFC